MTDNVSMSSTMEATPARGNILGALIGGLLGAALGAAIWAGITVATGNQYAMIAVLVGLTAGLGTRLLGRSSSALYGIVGAATALLGVIAGNFAAIYLLTQRELGDLASALPFDFYVETFGAVTEGIDLLFYGLAILIGFTTVLNRGRAGK